MDPSMMRTLSLFIVFPAFFLLGGCSEKVSVSTDSTPSATTSSGTPLENSYPDKVENSANKAGKAENLRLAPPSGRQVGVYFMPSWDDSFTGEVGRDVFWACLQGKENCPFLTDPNIWGPKGRIYNKKYPYEGPYLDKKPHKSLKGFYKRDDPEVIKKQLEYMKSYGIDFFAYNWYFGRHYYYHKDFAPQANEYYPKGWPVDKSRDGRVLVPGVEEWEEQLTVMLQVNEQLPKEKQMKFALNWVDDGPERWRNWLELGSPQNIRNKVNFPGEKPDKALYLKVHDKITHLWIDKYFRRDDYLKDTDGRPVVYFYFPHDTESRAALYNVSLKELLDRSKKLAREAGLKGIKFIAVTSGSMLANERAYAMPTEWKPTAPQQPWVGGTYERKLLFQDYVPRLKGMGFEGLTAYIYHSFYHQGNKSYKDMIKTYKNQWETWSQFYKDDPQFDYQIPVAMGWNMKPMGGTWPQSSGFPSEPQKDEVISNKNTFKQKLVEARKISEKYNSTNGNTIMVCCWNEYLEGNHIEPTVGHGFDYLEAIEEVLSD
jgi:hypothetical protein